MIARLVDETPFLGQLAIEPSFYDESRTINRASLAARRRQAILQWYSVFICDDELFLS